MPRRRQGLDYGGDNFEVAHKNPIPFHMVPNAFRDTHARQLGLREQCVYHAILRYAGSTGEAWPSHRTIAESIGVSRRTVIRAISTLVKLGYVERQTRRNPKNGAKRSNKYILTDLDSIQLSGGSDHYDNDTDAFPCVTADTTHVSRCNIPCVTTDTTHVSPVTHPLEKEHIEKEHTKNTAVPNPAVQRAEKESSPGECPPTPTATNSPALFNDSVSPKLPDQFDALAARFRDGLIRRREISSHDGARSRLDLSAKAFRLFVKHDQWTEAEVAGLVDWYIKDRPKGGWIPRAYCGETFCLKFARIWEARERWLEENGEPTMDRAPEPHPSPKSKSTPIHLTIAKDWTPEQRRAWLTR